MIEVKLDLYELMITSQNGLMRVYESMRLGHDWGHGFKGSLNEKIAKSISGSQAELSVAKYLQIEHTYHVNHGNNADLIFHDTHLQIRSQLPKKNNSLIIRPQGSKPGEIYILVIDKAPIFEIHGFVNSTYVLGSEKYLTDFNIANRPKCHAIPINLLTPIDLLKNGAWN